MTATMKSKTVPDALYFLDGGMILCGEHCGMSAKYTLRDISGQRIKRVTADDAAAWLADIGKPIACERCGRAFKVKLTTANSPLLAYVKRQYNKPTFKNISEIMNIQTDGVTIAIESLLRYVREDLRDAERTALLAIAKGGK